jgi:hypothetical protein
MEITRFWLLHFLDWKCSTPLLRIPGSRSWLGFSFSGVRTLNCPLFLNRQMEITRFWLLHFLDWKRSTPLLRIPGSRSWLGFSFSGVRTLNCPLFESVEIEHAKKP